MARSLLRGQASATTGRLARHRVKQSKVRFGLRPRLESLERRDLLASYTTPEDTPLSVSDASLVGVVVITPPDHGKVSLAATGGFVYLPNLNYNGPDRFIYGASPNNGTPPTTGTEVSITVTPVNDPPEAHGDQFLALQNTTLTIDSPGVLKNDTDIDSNALTAKLVAQASHGTVTLKDGGGFTYVPASDYTGPDSFTYNASDGQATSNTATVSLYVANNTVIARDNAYVALQNTVLNIAAPGVLGNDTGINGRPLTATLEPNTGPQHGTLTLNSDGSFSYAPAQDFVGPDSFVYRATDVSPLANPLPASSATAKVTINVRSTAPIVLANNDVFYGLQNTALSIVAPGVLKNDYVVSADATNATAGGTLLNIPLTSVVVAGPTHGTLDLKLDGSFSFTPDKDFSGSDTFTYRAVMSPPPGSTTAPTPNPISHDVATVTLNIKANNTPPEAHDDFYSVAQDTALTVAAPGVLGNDKGVLGHTLATKLGDNPSHGTLALNADGSFTYTPNVGYSGPDLFTYRAVDTSGQDPNNLPTSPLAKVSIYVRSTAPIVLANNDTYSTPQNAALTIAAPGVLKNDYVLSPDASNTTGNGTPLDIPLSAKLVTDVTHGTLSLNANGGFSFTPEKDFVGPATFTYQAVMTPPAGSPTLTPSPNSRDIATVTIYVKPLNPPPVARNDFYPVLQDTTLTVAAPGVLGNDTGPTGHQLAVSLGDNATNGLLTLNADGSFVYTPKGGFTGYDKFTYTVTDITPAPTTTDNGDGTIVQPPVSNLATVYIYVQPIHPPAYAFDDNYKTLPGTKLTIAAPGVLANDTLIPPPLPLNPSGDTDSTSSDGAPSPIPIPFPNTGYTITATLKSDVSHGSLTLNPDGSFTYTPDPEFTGPDTFTYQATATANGAAAGSLTANSTNDPIFPCTIDGPCLTPPDDIATVTIFVKPPEPPPGPVAVNDYFVDAENTTLSINAPGVLRNDYVKSVVPAPGTTNLINQPPTFPLTAVLVAGPSNGTLTLNPDGSFKYEPNPDFVGSDTFTYQASLATTATDSTTPILSNIATVTIKVVPAIAHNDQYQTQQDTTLNVPKPGVLANDSGGSAAHPLMATPLSGPLHGTLTLSADGSFVYTPKSGYSGPDLFTYRASDGTTPPPTNTLPGTTAATDDPNNGTPSNAIDIGIVRIYVRPTLSGIQAHDDKFPAIVNTTLDIPAPGVLANDFGPVNVPVVATLVTDVQRGKLTLNADGSFTYTPGTDFTGEDHFTYSAAPADPNSPIKGGTATVTIYVMAANAIPKVIIGGDQTTTDESGPQIVTDWATVCSVDDDGQPATFTVTTDNPNLFTAPPTIDATGQLTYTPAPNVSGDANITVVTHDDSGDTTQTFSIHVDKPHPLYNAANPYDVNNDKFVAPSDVVTLINYLNASGDPSVDAPAGEDDALPYYDVTRDNFIAPNDALMIINAINAGLDGGAGEGDGEATASDNVDAGLLTLVAQDTAEATMGRKRSG